MAAFAVRLRAGATVTPGSFTVVLRRVRWISGIARDQTGAALPFASVYLIRTSDKKCMGQTTADANGMYAVPVNDLAGYQAVAARFDEISFDSDQLTFDSDQWTFDAMQIDGVTLNSLVGA